MNRGAWRATVHAVTKSRTWLSTHACTHTHISREKSHILGNSSVSAKSRPLVTLGIRRLLWKKSRSSTSLLVEESKIPAYLFLLGQPKSSFVFFFFLPKLLGQSNIKRQTFLKGKTVTSGNKLLYPVSTLFHQIFSKYLLSSHSTPCTRLVSRGMMINKPQCLTLKTLMGEKDK